MTGFSTDPRGLSRLEKIEQALLSLFSANGFLTTSGADASGDLIFQTGGVERGRIISDGSATGLLNSASPEELVAGVGPVSVTDGTAIICFVAPFACNVKQASLVSWSTDQAASNTDYYSVAINRYRAGVSAQIAIKTTQNNSTSEAITQKVDWNYDAVTFDATNQQLVKSDVVAFVFSKTLAPADLAQVFVQIRYEPV